MTAIGTKRPREGRCERCDRPLTGEVYEHFEAYGADGREVRATDPEWLALVPTGDGECEGDKHVCRGPSVDWRARALAAEADARRHDAALADLLGIALDHERERKAAFIDGAQHGALAAAMLVDASYDEARAAYCGETNERGNAYWEGVMDDCDSMASDLLALAKEATDGR